MPNLNIAPQTVLLTSGQPATFEATDATGKPALVTWSLNSAPDPVVGKLVAPTAPGAEPSASTPASSATYVAPSPVGTAQTIAIVARTATDAASATISLTTIAIVPSKVDLGAGQMQQFSTIVAAVPVAGAGAAATAPEEITWILSPPLGTLDKTGLYTSPRDIQGSETVRVIATSPTPGNQAVAIVNLITTPWHGLGVDFLGGFLLLVFSLVFVMIGLWPPALPSPEAAKIDLIQAEKEWEERTKLYNDALAAPRAPLREQKLAPEKQEGRAGVANPPTPTTRTTKNLTVQSTEPTRASDDTGAGTGTGTATGDDLVWRAQQALDYAESDLREKRAVVATVNDSYVKTRLVGHINRELDLLFLVLLAGTLGSFLHTAQSYSDYVGNRELKRSWAWWYSLRPFIGAGLALVFYAAVRGGVLALATSTTPKTSELNPFGVISVAAMVGMFSKAATTKLGEVFDTLFKTDKTMEKDRLGDMPPSGSSQSSQSVDKPSVSATITSTGTK